MPARFLPLLMALLVCVSATAQTLPTPYSPSFHSSPNAQTWFQYDIPDSIFYSPSTIYQLLYRETGAGSWSQTPMNIIYRACTSWTVSGSTNFVPPSGNLEYYFRSETDTIVVSQSPKNTANTFPAPADLLADMGSDPTGDAVSALGQWLDITGAAMSYSDTRIYGRLTNAGGGFPTSSGLNFFLYSVGIVDPDGSDSSAYAMIYINVPILFSSGLYRINAADSSFTKIGNISTNISGNNLSMACNVSDLLAQPGWSTWPPPSGLILTAAVTATQSLSGSPSINDMGKTGAFVPAANSLTFGGNTAPALSGGTVSVVGGNARGAVVFTDADNNLATVRQFVFAGTPYDMTACAKNFLTGTTFQYDVPLDTSGWYQYSFVFSDGKDTVSTTPASVYLSLAQVGDCDNNGLVNISDAVFLISYIFAGGAAPSPLYIGDVNCDALVSISDVVYLIAYIFAGGSPPCSPL